MTKEDELREALEDCMESIKMFIACGIVAKFPKDDDKTFLETKMFAEKAINQAKLALRKGEGEK